MCWKIRVNMSNWKRGTKTCVGKECVKLEKRNKGLCWRERGNPSNLKRNKDLCWERRDNASNWKRGTKTCIRKEESMR